MFHPGLTPPLKTSFNHVFVLHRAVANYYHETTWTDQRRSVNPEPAPLLDASLQTPIPKAGSLAAAPPGDLFHPGLIIASEFPFIVK